MSRAFASSSALCLALFATTAARAATEPRSTGERSWSRVAAESWLARAESQVSRGETLAALTSYTHALRADASLGRAYLGLAVIRRAQGDYRQTEWLLTRAVSLPEVRADALTSRADLYEQLGRGEEALLDLRHAAEVEPSLERLQRLGERYAARRVWVAALAVWRQVRAQLGDSREDARRHADEMVEALAILAAETDTAQHDTGERDWVRRVLRRHARR